MRLTTRLLCHYCGRKSKKSKLDSDRFECEKCGSLNAYDEKGEIVDIVPDEADLPRQYAAPAAFREHDIFCSICLKNQYLYTTALAQFLPDPDDPSYSRLEAAVPKFKESLEERYPQCCARCEPKVKAQLEQVTYQARSDHMRRVLERSKERRLASRLGWRSLIVSATGVLYFVSLLVQLVWHAMGLTTQDAPPCALTECIPGGMVPLGWPLIIEPYIGWSILLALVCSWWNPQWRHKLHGQEGRLVGLGQYYCLQVVLLATRFAAWVWCVDFSTPQSLELLHTAFLASMIGLSSWAMLTVRFDTAPLVKWDYRPPELVSRNQFAPPPFINEPRFNVMNLAPTTRPDLKPWQPPTPPLETDVMDWQPSQYFDPPKQARFRNPSSSPFHGVLPAFSGPATPYYHKPAIGIPPGHFDRKDRLPANNDGRIAMAEPKFFLRSSDTGLEDIFDQVFSLNEFSSSNDRILPHTTFELVSGSPTDQLPATTPAPEPVASSYIPLLLGTLMLIALLLWSLAGILEVAVPNLRLYVIGIALGRCMSRFALPSAFTTRAIISVEILVLLGLLGQLLNPNPTLHNIYRKIGGGLFAILWVQEVVLHLQSFRIGE